MTSFDDAANEVRSSYWIGQGLPVDPYTIARSMGIEVKEIEVESKIAGGIWGRSGYPPIVFINKGDPENRKRFICAHEIGHYYQRVIQGDGGEDYEYMDYRNSLSSTGLDPNEVFANGFAAALLMPVADVRRQWDTNPSRLSLASYFGVSPEALGWRLKNLGIA